MHRHLKSTTLAVFCASLWLAACSLNSEATPTATQPVDAEREIGGTESAEVEAPDDGPAAVEAAAEPGAEFYQTLLDTEIPPFDIIETAVSIGGLPRESLPPLPDEPIKTYQVGDSEGFWLTHIFEGRTYEVTARLAHISDHAYFWVHDEVEAVNERGQVMSEEDWIAAGEDFDEAYEQVQAVFGSESNPGIDGDARMHILHSDIEHMGRIFGYFSGGDGLPAVVYPESNEKDMFFVAIDRFGEIDGPGYVGVLAHEYQHAIQQNIDPDETLWLNEAMSKVAEVVASGGADDRVETYTDETDQSLWYWGNTVGDYFHGFFLLDYLSVRAGDAFMPTLSRDSRRGIESIEGVLDELGVDESFDDLFGDFMAAMFIDDEGLVLVGGDWEEQSFALKWVHPGRVPVSDSIENDVTIDGASDTRHIEGTVNQYGIDAVRITGKGYVEIGFDGEPSTALVPTDAVSGEWMWWSNREDNMFTTLTRAVDLRGVEDAELRYQAWYETDSDFDYGYVLVSTDGGERWTPVESTSSTRENPQNLNFGFGMTGMSGGDGSEWVEERVDLSAFAGQAILLRFAMITDSGVAETGLLIDDVGIEAIDWFDDFETDDGQWLADGFVRINNVVPQRWIIRAVWFDAEHDAIYVSDLDYLATPSEESYDAYLGEDDDLLILISGATQFTTEPGSYSLSVRLATNPPEE